MTRSELSLILHGRPPLKRFCTVRQVLPRGRFQVETSAGALLTVESESIYRVGDQVTVVDNRIVGAARRYSVQKTYRV